MTTGASSGGGFKRDLSEEELKDLVHSGGKMAASMRQVLATASEQLAKLRDVNESLRAGGPALAGEQRSAVSASLNAVSGSLNALQASLKLVGGAVSETADALGGAA
jgi:ActR/RegA family two-component response regulator